MKANFLLAGLALVSTAAFATAGEEGSTHLVCGTGERLEIRLTNSGRGFQVSEARLVRRGEQPQNLEWSSSTSDIAAGNDIDRHEIAGQTLVFTQGDLLKMATLTLDNVIPASGGKVAAHLTLVDYDDECIAPSGHRKYRVSCVATEE